MHNEAQRASAAPTTGARADIAARGLEQRLSRLLHKAVAGSRVYRARAFAGSIILPGDGESLTPLKRQMNESAVRNAISGGSPSAPKWRKFFSNARLKETNYSLLSCRQGWRGHGGCLQPFLNP